MPQNDSHFSEIFFRDVPFHKAPFQRILLDGVTYMEAKGLLKIFWIAVFLIFFHLKKS